VGVDQARHQGEGVKVDQLVPGHGAVRLDRHDQLAIDDDVGGLLG
jgi:hypothetical protein